MAQVGLRLRAVGGASCPVLSPRTRGPEYLPLPLAKPSLFPPLDPRVGTAALPARLLGEQLCLRMNRCWLGRCHLFVRPRRRGCSSSSTVGKPSPPLGDSNLL